MARNCESYELPLLVKDKEGSKLLDLVLNRLCVNGGRGASVDTHASAHLYEHFLARNRTF